MKASPTGHPAPFSAEVLDVIEEHGPGARVDRRLIRVHDPFAGDGVRLGALCDRMGWTFSGTELERPFIVDRRVVQGNACDRSTYPRGRFVIVTSPVYPNGIADHFNAQDDSERRTYRTARAKITGRDRPLHYDNQGRYGYRGSGLTSPTRAMYWNIAGRAVACWSRAEAIYLNVSDFPVGNRVEPLVNQWCVLIEGLGWTIEWARQVSTPRYRNGANRTNRVDGEVVAKFVRP